MPSSVLHQRFLTGLRLTISRQLLLRKKTTELSEAIEEAVEVKYALGFDGGRVAVQEGKDINLLQPSPALWSDEQLYAMTERMEALESALASTRTRGWANNTMAEGTSRPNGPTKQPG